MTYQEAVEGIEGVTDSEWIPEIGIYQVKCEYAAPITVVDRLREVLPVGIVPVKVLGDGQGGVIINCKRKP